MEKVILFVVLAGIAGLALYFWARSKFRSTPEGRWATLIQAQVHTLQKELALLDAGPVLPAEEQRLKDDHFQRYLTNLPLEVLQEYTGIGPGTVERLRGWGLKNFGDCIGYHFERIDGIGPVKHGDLVRATDAVQIAARKTFEMGECAEAQEYRNKTSAAQAARQSQVNLMRQQADAIRRILASGSDKIQAASKVTLLNYIQNGLKVPFVDPMILGSSLGPSRPTTEPVTPIPPPVVATGSATAMPASTGSVSFPSPPPVAPPPPPAKKPTGDLFERELGRGSSPAPPPSSNPGLDKLRAFCGFAMMAAKADGRATKAEKDILRQHLGDIFGGDPTLLRHLDPTLESFEKNVPSQEDAIAAVKQHATATELKTLHKLAEKITDATSGRNASEQAMLARIAEGFGVAVTAEQRPSAPPTPAAPPMTVAPVTDARTVLEIEPGVELTVDLIRRKYNLLTDKNDPQKAAAFGEAIAKQVEAKRREVRAAAESLIAPFGEPLEKPQAAPPTDLRENSMLDDVFGA
ncbi:MAG: TerB family tellurite resistance protein [Fimbriiglobus sp.]